MFVRWALVALLGFMSHAAQAVVCTFNMTGGSWDTPANWSGCVGGNGNVANTPGPADTAIIGAATVSLGSATYTVADLVLNANASINGVSAANTNLVVTAANTSTWSGPRTFGNLKVTLQGNLDASGGTTTLNDANLETAAGRTVHFGAISINGATATVDNYADMLASGNVTTTAGGTFSNHVGGGFTAFADLTISGSFTNAGRLSIAAFRTLTLGMTAVITQSAATGRLDGTGTLSAAGQTLNLAGTIEGSLTFNLGTLLVANGSLSPDSSPAKIGTITVNGNLQLGPGVTYNFDVAAGIMAPAVDRIAVSGALQIDPGADVQGNFVDDGMGFYVPVVGDQLVILTNTGTRAGTFGNYFPPFGQPSQLIHNANDVRMLINAHVTNTNDSGPGSLREALAGMAGCDVSYRVTFDLGMTGGTIRPQTPLPPLMCSGAGLDGYSHPGSTVNTAPIDWNANLKVTIDGSMCISCSEAIRVNGSGISIAGINFTNWSRAIDISGMNNDNAVVRGNHFSLNDVGVLVSGAGNGIKIGDRSDPAGRNVIINAANEGIRVEMFTGVSLGIENNLIGLGASAAPGPNGTGVYVASTNGVQLEDNVIAHNGRGLSIVGGSLGTGYRRGNKIFSNSVLGVDIGADGPTANDDAMPPYDTDAADRPNFPVIDSVADMGGGVTRVNYTLRTNPNVSTYVCFCGSQNLTENQCRSAPICTNASTDAGGALSAHFDLPQTGQFALPTRITAFQQPESGPKAGSTSEISPGVNLTAAAPGFGVVPMMHDFGARIVGFSSASQPFTVTNTGSADLTISAVSVSPPFTIVSQNCTGMAIPPMGTCTVTALFDPVAVGAASAPLVITSNAPGSPHMVSLAGSGIAAPTVNMGVAPASVVLGGSSMLTITLNNGATSPLPITSGSMMLPSGVAVAAMPAPTTNCGSSVTAAGQTISFTGGSIPPAGNCFISVPLTTSAIGTYPINFAANALVTALGSNVAAASTSLTVTGAGPYGYVANFGSFSGTTVTAIDLPTNTVAATINVGTGPVAAIVNYAGTRAYVSNQQSASVSVIDTANNTVVATVPVGSQPGFLGINPAGTRVYVPNQSSNNVSVIDTGSNTVVATIPGINFPVAAVTNALGSKAFIASFSGNTLEVVDTSSNTVIGSIAVCASPYNLALNPNGSRIYVVCNSGNVSVVDPGTGTVVTTIAVGGTLRAMAINPAGTRAYVAGATGGVAIVDLVANAVSSTVAAGSGPFGAAGNPAGTRVYVVNSGSNNVSVFDTSTDSIIATVPTGANPLAIGVQPPPVIANPLVSLSPATVAFGSRTVMTTSPPTTVTLTNSGSAPLVINSITGSGDFGFTSTCPLLSPPLGVGASCSINVTFTPLTVATLSGAITIVSNAPGSPHSIALTGTGVPGAVPGISLSATSLALGGTTINTTSAQQALGITNSGLATLNLTSVTLSGPFARVAPITGTNCGATLAPMAVCRIAVTCTPTVIGNLTGTLTIVHNATGSPTVVNLSCTGNPVPVATIALPGSVDFGDQVLNTPSASQTVTITNTGTLAMNVGAITLSGANAADFSIAGACTSVAPGASCALTVVFTPRATGARVAALGIASDAANGATVNTVRLTGNGVLAPRPIALLSLTTIGYGNSVFGGATSAQTVQLKNEGGVALAIASIAATGDYSVSHNCGASLASQATCTVNVSFVPTAIGPRPGELQVISNAQGSPHKVQLNGTGCRWFSQTTSRFFLTSCG